MKTQKFATFAKKGLKINTIKIKNIAKLGNFHHAGK